MPRYTAPNHPDCYIDCPGKGFAIYIPPFGPCRTSCEVANLPRAMGDLAEGGWDTRSSGSVKGISHREIREISRRLRRIRGRTGAINDVLDDLDRIRGVQSPIDFEWSDLDVVEILDELRRLAGGPMGGPIGGPMGDPTGGPVATG